MSLEASRAAREISRALRGKAPARPWEKLQAYVSSPVPVLGVAAPDLREVLRDFTRAHPRLTIGEVNAVASALWALDTFEERVAAMELFARHRKILGPASWGLLDRMAGGASGWGLCDALGSGPVAAMVFDDPRRFPRLLRWARSRNPWRRRVAAYGLRGFVRAKELDRPFELLEILLYDPEFWVQRAVGTWLLECWKVDPRRTEAFLRSRAKGLPPVVITVATERASNAFREELRRKRGRSRTRAASRSSP